MDQANSECIFCRIVAEEIPAKVIYQDQQLLAFEDIAPKAPVHQLIIPKRHIATLNQVEDAALLGQMSLLVKQLAQQFGVAESGYRLLVNCNEHGGQEVFHLHMHLLGGKKLAF